MPSPQEGEKKSLFWWEAKDKLDRFLGNLIHWWIENWTTPQGAVFLTVTSRTGRDQEVVLKEEKFFGISFLWFFHYPSIGESGAEAFRRSHAKIPVWTRVLSSPEMENYLFQQGLHFSWRKTAEKIFFPKSGKNLRQFDFSGQRL